MRKHFLWIGAALVALTACGNTLDVANTNQPDVARAYATPPLVEGVVGGLDINVFNSARASESINTQSQILSGMSYATVANFGMAARTQIPRSPLSNDLGNDQQAGNLSNFNAFSRAARTGANVVQSIVAYKAKGLTMGSDAQDARAKAWAYFVLGQSLGYLSLGYDSAAIVTPLTASSDVPALSAAKDVNVVALAMLDSAIATANGPAASSGGSNGFPLPSTWYSGIADINAAKLVRMARSFKAKFRAGVARTPADRAAVDWNAVISDATNGITSDLAPAVLASTGWSVQFDISQLYVGQGWHEFPLLYAGMADISGGYDNWLKVPIATRGAFLVVTPDLRWPQGGTRVTQQAEAPVASTILPTGRYIRNRQDKEDFPSPGWGDSWYDFHRYIAAYNATSGNYVDLAKAEVDMLAAEGYIRQGNLAAAQALIDITRIRNGLGSVGVPANKDAPYSTAANCVPRVPQAPNYTSTACGSIWEAMKYEKRMETAMTGYLTWYTDNRGWGDLVTGTPVEWAVPYQEMQSRFQTWHASSNQAAKGTYGF